MSPRRARVLWRLAVAALLLVVTGLVHHVFQLRELHSRVRDWTDLDHRKTLRRLDDLLDGAAEDPSRLREARDLLSSKLGAAGKGASLTCGEGLAPGDMDVCGEAFGGTKIPQTSSCYNSSWSLEWDGCPERARAPDWGALLTVVVVPRRYLSAAEIEESLLRAYPGVSVVVAVPPGARRADAAGLPGVRVVEAQGGEAWPWAAAARSASTPYVLFGWDLATLGPSARLERTVRLLADPAVGAVAGAGRNLTGHWRAPCYQAGVSNYRLQVRPGYEESACDCMLCSLAAGAPFATRADVLSAHPLDSSGGASAQAMFVSWFLDLQRAGLRTLLCPDVLYLTYGNAWPPLPRPQWAGVARRHGFQAVSTDAAPRTDHAFSCREAGLECRPRGLQQPAALLLPWCCLSSYAHILRELERAATEFGFHYELDSGSCLGAVKLGQFLPWDIDGDISVPTEAVPLFASGAPAAVALEAAGIDVYRRSDDNYGDRGAGYFMLWHGGVEVEMLGRRGPLLATSEACAPLLRGVPTRALIGDVWARVHPDPGGYARSRYGPGYLRHAQSWRYQGGMADSFAAYAAAGGRWRQCDDPSDPACLERYPADGNVLFHPEAFRDWREPPSRDKRS